MSTKDSPQLRQRQKLIGLLAFSAFLLLGSHFSILAGLSTPSTAQLPLHADISLARCHSLHVKPGPPPNFHQRSQSDRFAHGTRPTLIRNAKLLTGNKNGTEVVHGDLLLDKGVIKGVGYICEDILVGYGRSLDILDVHGAWVTAGIVDMHSHLGDASSPALDGASNDDNSIKGPVLPWLRSLDSLNTHDDSYALSIAGGVTTTLVLPGSANAIGGQGFTIKLRKTDERTPTSMLLEPPHQINKTSASTTGPPRWRQMKHACGENPSRVYSQTRMDTVWNFRSAYNKAKSIKGSQDTYCHKAIAGQWDGLGEFPEDLQWEALVDVLRGKVKVQSHCYESLDLDNFVRLSNEFEFPVAAFHHASEAFLVPDVLKQAYGHPPGIALFAIQGRYKREAYRASEFAPRILTQHGLKVAMKSDHPVMNSRYLLFEAQQAHYYGLPANLALASVTGTPAQLLGLDHRVGFLKEGWDADVVVWDSHPLALGATPSQVFIDGIPQLESPHVIKKPQSFQSLPRTPDFEEDLIRAIQHEGLPPLTPQKTSSDIILFTNVTSVFTRAGSNIYKSFSATGTLAGVVLVQNGTIVCSGSHASCTSSAALTEAERIDLRGGSISPGLVSYGSPLGLEEINQEDSTNDGNVFDPLIYSVPKILGGDSAVVRAADGLQYGTRDALLAYRAGVTSGITAPSHGGFYAGLGVSFSTSARHKLEDSSLQEIAGLHLSIRHFGTSPSVSTQIAALRHLLLAETPGEAGRLFGKAAHGEISLVIDAHSADIIATLILLKREVESQARSVVKLTIAGASEAHILAKELGQAGVGVIVRPRPFPENWEDRRIIPGPPLTEESAILKLLRNNVTVGISADHGEIWSTRNTRFDIAWVSLEAGGAISKEQAIALGSTNVDNLLGVETNNFDMVATQGGDLLDMESKVVAVISSQRKTVDLF